MWKELIQEKGTQSTQLSVQNLKIKFVLFKCHRSISNSNDFYLFILTWKSSLYQRIQLWKFKTSSWIMNHDPLSGNRNPIFIFSVYLDASGIRTWFSRVLWRGTHKPCNLKYDKLNVFPSGDSKKLKIKKSKNSKFTMHYFLQKWKSYSGLIEPQQNQYWSVVILMFWWRGGKKIWRKFDQY